MGLAAALRHAQLWLRDEAGHGGYANPFYWTGLHLHQSVKVKAVAGYSPMLCVDLFGRCTA